MSNETLAKDVVEKIEGYLTNHITDDEYVVMTDDISSTYEPTYDVVRKCMDALRHLKERTYEILDYAEGTDFGEDYCHLLDDTQKLITDATNAQFAANKILGDTNEQ